MSMFFLLTLYMQDIGHYSALRSSLAYLPFGIAMLADHMQYASHVLPATIMYGFAQGIIMPGLRFASLHGTGPADSGLASGLQNTTLQVGGSPGLAVLVTVALLAGAILIAAALQHVNAVSPGQPGARPSGRAAVPRDQKLPGPGHRHGSSPRGPPHPGRTCQPPSIQNTRQY